MHVVMPLECSMIDTRGKLVYFDVVYPDANSPAALSSEALMQALIPYLLPMLTDAITEIEIPSIDGFGILNHYEELELVGKVGKF